MATSKEKEWLISEIQVLTDGKLSHVDFNSDPDDPSYNPKDDRRLTDSCTLKIVGNLHNEQPHEEEDAGMPSDPVEALPGTSCAQAAAKRRKKEENILRTWMTKDLSVDDTAWKGQLPLPPEQVQSPYEYVCAFFW